MPFELGRDAVSVSSLQRKHISFEHDLQTLGSAVRKPNDRLLYNVSLNGQILSFNLYYYCLTFIMCHKNSYYM